MENQAESQREEEEFKLDSPKVPPFKKPHILQFYEQSLFSGPSPIEEEGKPEGQPNFLKAHTLQIE